MKIKALGKCLTHNRVKKLSKKELFEAVNELARECDGLQELDRRKEHSLRWLKEVSIELDRRIRASRNDLL